MVVVEHSLLGTMYHHVFCLTTNAMNTIDRITVLSMFTSMSRPRYQL